MRNLTSKNPIEWWDEDCHQAIENRKSKLKKFLRSQDIKDFIEYKKAIALIRKVIKFKKKEDFKK